MDSTAGRVARFLQTASDGKPDPDRNFIRIWGENVTTLYTQLIFLQELTSGQLATGLPQIGLVAKGILIRAEVLFSK